MISSLEHIGIYYTDNGSMNLYKSKFIKSNWITNIIYFDTTKQKYFSPSLKNIVMNGRTLTGEKKSESYWLYFIEITHASFVLLLH